MSLAWNEIKSRALLFSHDWSGFADETLNDNKHRQAISKAEQYVLDARAQFAGSSVDDLYDPLIMVQSLLNDHHKNDASENAANACNNCKKTYTLDAKRIRFVFALYERITSLLPAPATKKTCKPKAKES